jgi:hypothetical protein
MDTKIKALIEHKIREMQQEILEGRFTAHAPPDSPASHAPKKVMLKRSGRADDRQVGGAHYTQMAITPWDVVDTWPMEQRIGAYRFGTLKYTMRLGQKDMSVQEAKKGLHFMEKLVETLEEQEKESQKLSNTYQQAEDRG